MGVSEWGLGGRLGGSNLNILLLAIGPTDHGIFNFSLRPSYVASLPVLGHLKEFSPIQVLSCLWCCE